MISFRTLICFSLILSNVVFCKTAGSQTQGLQQNSLPVFRKVSYPFLPSLSSRYFFFSEDGLMWFSSDRGLTSFDGTEAVYHCTPQQSVELGLNFIGYMVEDNDHNFYIATRYQLIFFNRKERKFHSLQYIFKEFGEQNLGLMTIHIDNEGVIYLGAYSRGLFIYYPSVNKVVHINMQDDKPDGWENRNYNTVSCFQNHAKDASMIWIGTYNGIYLYNKKTNTLQKNFIVTTPQYRGDGIEREYYDVEKMDVVNDSTIWFNMWSGGFCRYNSKNGKTVVYLQSVSKLTGKPFPLFTTPSFIKISDGNYMIGVSQGQSVLFDALSGAAQYFNITPDQNALDAVQFCGKDKQDNIWILRNSQLYVSIPTHSRLRSVVISDNTEEKKPYHNEARGVYFDKETNCYYFAVRFSDRIYVIDTNFKKVQTIPGISCDQYGYKTCGTDRITKDGSGRFWATGFKIHVKLHGQSKFNVLEKVFPRLAWLNKAQISDAITTRDGNILFRCNADAYFINHINLTVDTLRPLYYHNSYDLQFTNSPMAYDSTRDYLYLSDANGISQYQLNHKTWRRLPYKEMFGNVKLNKRILKFSLDAKGRIWLLVDLYGIRILNPETLFCVDSIRFADRGLPPGLYTDIICGEPGYMILHGTHGIVLYQYDSQQAFIFNSSNGLSYNSSYSLLHSNGNLFVGQADHIEYFNIRDFLKNYFYYLPVLNSFKVNAVESLGEILNSGTITLPSTKNNISLSFSTLEFVFPERVEYAYQLSGIDAQWNYSNYFNRSINYNNLPPGHYVFKIKAQQLGGNWSNIAREFIITITPPFWNTYWFKACIFVTMLGLIYFMVRWRLQSVRKQEREKNKHEKELLELEAQALRAQMNPHFIFNCMNSIKALIQNEERQKSIDYLTTFSKLIRTLFNNSDKRQVSLHDELETCKLYTQLEAMRLDGKLQYQFDINENLDLKSVMVPALIIQPFIENAIWHGIVPKEKGKVCVKVNGNDENILCEIEDDGIGRETSKNNKPATTVIHHSKGINLSQARLNLEKILSDKNASVEILDKYENTVATGTRVIIEFKLQ
jgi:two-component sensor histidine kinase